MESDAGLSKLDSWPDGGSSAALLKIDSISAGVSVEVIVVISLCSIASILRKKNGSVHKTCKSHIHKNMCSWQSHSNLTVIAGLGAIFEKNLFGPQLQIKTWLAEIDASTYSRVMMHIGHHYSWEMTAFLLLDLIAVCSDLDSWEEG